MTNFSVNTGIHRCGAQRRRRWKALWHYVLYLLTLPLNGASQVQGEDGISQLRQSLQRLRTVNARLVAEASLQIGVDSPKSQRSIFTVRRTPDRSYLSCEYDIDSEKRFKSEWLLRTDGLVYIQAALPRIQGTRQAPENLVVTFANDDIAGTSQRATIERMFIALADSGLPLGFIGTAWLNDYISRDIQFVPNAALSLLYVKSNSAHGHIDLWLHRDYGYLPQRLILTKQDSDIFNFTPLDETQRSKQRPITKIIWRSENVELRRHGDVPYIGQCTLVAQTFHDDASLATTTTHMTVEEIDFSPAFGEQDFLPQLQIPLGHPVTVVGAPQLPYRWNGHSPIPTTAPIPSSDDLEGATSSVHRFRWGLIMLNAAVLFVIACVLGRRLLRRDRKR